MKIKKGFVVRKVAGENIVVPVGGMSKTFHGMIKLNDTGEFSLEFFSQRPYRKGSCRSASLGIRSRSVDGGSGRGEVFRDSPRKRFCRVRRR